jgi:hypothetical protein
LDPISSRHSFARGPSFHSGLSRKQQLNTPKETALKLEALCLNVHGHVRFQNYMPLIEYALKAHQRRTQAQQAPTRMLCVGFTPVSRLLREATSLKSRQPSSRLNPHHSRSQQSC